jgi:hypothetical protein
MAIVHCFRCDDVVEVDTSVDGPLWCAQCDGEVLGPPSETGDRRVWWSPSGMLLAGQSEEDAATWRPRRPGRGGSIVGAAMLGLYQAIYGPVDDQPAIEILDDEPDDDDDIQLHLDEEHREASWIRFRNRP